jgi:hypothetical protein
VRPSVRPVVPNVCWHWIETTATGSLRNLRRKVPDRTESAVSLSNQLSGAGTARRSRTLGKQRGVARKPCGFSLASRFLAGWPDDELRAAVERHTGRARAARAYVHPKRRGTLGHAARRGHCHPRRGARRAPGGRHRGGRHSALLQHHQRAGAGLIRPVGANRVCCQPEGVEGRCVRVNPDANGYSRPERITPLDIVGQDKPGFTPSSSDPPLLVRLRPVQAPATASAPYTGVARSSARFWSICRWSAGSIHSIAKCAHRLLITRSLLPAIIACSATQSSTGNNMSFANGMT